MRNHFLTSILIVALAALFGCQSTPAPKSFPELTALRDSPEEQADILILGMFHFADAGLDSYKPAKDIDVFSEQRQREIEDILDRLEQFAPTRIALEARWQDQGWLDSMYHAFLEGAPPTSNERQQIGFRLAQRLGHTKVYAVDADRRSFFEGMSREEFQQLRSQGTFNGLDDEIWAARYRALYEHDDSLKHTWSIREHLLYANSPERLRAGHGHYLISTFQVGDTTDYFGADASISWYARNLRIFHNLIRITESPDDRILLVIGAGHAPIISFVVDASPQYRLVPVSEVLAD